MDIAILVFYFLLLLILSVFGAHRYYLLYLYLKHRKDERKPKDKFKELPGITVQLPLYNEMYVAERLIDAVCKFDYPKDKMEIQVLDDSTDETKDLVSRVVKKYQERGFDIKHIHREDRTGYKAGALENGMKLAKYDFFAIFDADFIPPPEFLKQTIHYFTDPKVGMVQIRWGHINRNYSLLTEVQSILLDGHFVLEHTVRNRSGRFFNFNGTGGIWRKQAIIDGGGWQHDTLTEDLDLSYRVQMKGWEFVYIPDLISPAELPVSIKAFKTQQHRWAKGAIQTGKKLMPRILKSNLPLKIKIEAFFHLCANIAYLFMIPLSIAIFPTVIIRRNLNWDQMIIIDIPFLLLATFSFSSFYFFAQKEVLKKWSSKIKYLPFVSAIGIGLSVNNAIAVWQGLTNKKSEFVRTPKYGVKKSGEDITNKKYKSRMGYLPFIELLFGIYFTITVIVSIQRGIYLTIPFLLIFQFGYLYMALLSFSEDLKLFFLKKKNLKLAK